MEIVIIANKGVEENSVNKAELRNIYLGDKSEWSNGEEIKFVILKRGPAHEAFLDAYIKKNPKSFVRYWKKLILTGKAVSPKLVDTENDVLDYVSHTEGALGYVSADKNIQDLKQIKIE